MILHRILELNLPKGQSLFIWGARKTGKSTYLRDKYPNSIYIDFLKHSTFLEYSRDPTLLRQLVEATGYTNITDPIIIDEVQKVPDILDEVHWMIENFKGLSFIMCGSSLRKLKDMGSNLLGGRAWRQVFLPLCYSEMQELDLLRIFNHGLIPSHYLSSVYPKRSLEGYIVDYLIPEVRLESRMRELGGFATFLEAMAFSNAQVLNYTNIARECHVSGKTVQGYIDVLMDMLLGYVIHPYTKRSSRQLITAAPKFYFFDTALVNVLLRRKIEALGSPEAGHSFEHYIFLELFAYKNIKDLNYDIRYWRTKTGLEVDFIISTKKLFAIEVKLSSSVNKRDISGLITFSSDAKPARSLVVCLEEKRRIITIDGIKIEIWPAKEFLVQLWDGKIID